MRVLIGDQVFRSPRFHSCNLRRRASVLVGGLEFGCELGGLRCGLGELVGLRCVLAGTSEETRESKEFKCELAL